MYPESPPESQARCPKCGAKLRDERAGGKFDRRVADDPHAPLVTFDAPCVRPACPRCDFKGEPVLDEPAFARARADALQSFWLKYVHAANGSHKDVERVRLMLRKVAEDGTVEARWFTEWLLEGV